MTQDDSSSGLRSLSTRRRLMSIVSGSAGNLIEWYDWYAYSAFSLYFSKVFFPGHDPTAQLLNTAAIFAVGFLMRPIGGWLLGRYADTHGRRAAFLLSIYAMCAGSLLIAVLPGYAVIGVAAPMLLTVARLLQGLSVGGEYGASAAYLSEIATKEHRGLISSFQYVTLILGQLLAMGVLVALQHGGLSESALETWGWRLPFVIGALLTFGAFRLRRTMEETRPVHAPVLHEVPPVSPLRALARHPRAVLTVVGLTMGGTVAFYTYTTYMQKFLVNSVGLTKDAATLTSASSLVVFLCLQPLIGHLSDRIGRRPVLIAFGVLGTCLTVPLLLALAVVHSPWEAFGLLVVALTIVSGYTAINAVVKAELFPVEIRALGVGLPYAVTVSVFGGTAEYIALSFKHAGHEHYFFWYVTACIFCSLVVYLIMPETRDQSSIDLDAV